MTRRYFVILFIILVAVIAYFALNNNIETHNLQTKKSTALSESSNTDKDSATPEVAIDHEPQPSFPHEEKKFPVWESNLRQNILAQAGSQTPEISITKIKSFVIQRDGVSLNVDSVLVKLKVDKKEKTSFKALVDSETGKILQTWDQPVYDPIEHKDNFSIKIDPRYPQ